MKIVFMGTPNFAAASLQALCQAGYDIVGVVTAPDKPAGRGQKITASAVKQCAVKMGLKTLQPVKLKDPEFIKALKTLNADLQVVVAFRMLPEIIWNMPPKGTINLHASLLPHYRGAAPINHVIINGEKESGITTFFLKHEIDAGNIIFSKRIAVDDNETAGALHDKLMLLGANLLVKTVRAIEENKYAETPQPQSGDLKRAPKIFKDFCNVNWNQPGKNIYNLIRGLSPYPAAFTVLNHKILKIFSAEIEHKKPAISAGSFLSDGKTYLKFAAKDSFIKLTEVQHEGKKRLPIEDFLRGVKL